MMTAKEFFEEHLSGEPLTQDSVIEGMKLFAIMHVRAAFDAGIRYVQIEDDDMKDYIANLKLDV